MCTYFVGSDHAGLYVKDFVINYMVRAGLCYKDVLPIDVGDRVDYPDVAFKLCDEMLSHQDSYGILICGSGIGMSIAANRFSHIRAAVCHDGYTAKVAREHNNANVLCIGERVVGVGVISSILDAFLNSSFSGNRHSVRVNKLCKMLQGVSNE